MSASTGGCRHVWAKQGKERLSKAKQGRALQIEATEGEAKQRNARRTRQRKAKECEGVQGEVRPGRTQSVVKQGKATQSKVKA